MNDYIDLYCERIDPSLWAEPLNALSNLAFFLAAFFAWRALRRQPATRDLRALALLIAAVGAGSLAFHTLATRWAMWLDQGFIMVFMLTYLHRFLVRLPRWSGWAAGAGLLGFVALDIGLQRALAGLPLNGSQAYASAFTVLALMTVWAVLRQREAAAPLGIALGTFVISVSCRSADQVLCATWPWGTHFVWHLLNATVLYFCIEALRRGSAAQHQSRSPLAG